MTTQELIKAATDAVIEAMDALESDGAISAETEDAAEALSGRCQQIIDLIDGMI